MTEKRTGHMSPIERIIRSGGGQPTHGVDVTQEREERDYEPFVVDLIPRMGFTIYHYARNGSLTRHDVMFHEMKHRVTRTHGMDVFYSFDADGVVFQMRGGQNLYDLADAVVECKLQTVYVYDPKVWPEVDPGIEKIDRIAIKQLRREREEPFDEDDFDDDVELPGEKPWRRM